MLINFQLMRRVMGIVSVVMNDKERSMFEEYAKEMSMSLSTTVRTLAIQQLRQKEKQ